MEEYIQAYSPEFLKQLLITLEETGCTGNYIMEPKSHIAKKLYNCRSQPTNEIEKKDWWIISNTGINNCIDNTVKNNLYPEISYTEALKKARVPYEDDKKREAEFKKRAIKEQRAKLEQEDSTLREACGNTGYKGRTAIFEFIQVTQDMQELISKKPSSQEIWKQARKDGSQSLFEDGVLKVKNGVTTIEELLRVAEPPKGKSL